MTTIVTCKRCGNTHDAEKERTFWVTNDLPFCEDCWANMGVAVTGTYFVQAEDGSPYNFESHWPEDMTFCTRCGRYTNAPKEIWENCSCDDPVVIYESEPMNADIKKLIDRFLEEAGEHSVVYHRMVEEDFAPNAMVFQCGMTAKSHGFWDAHKQQAEKILIDHQLSIATNDGDVLAEDIVEALAKARLLGDPTIFLALIMTECGEAIEGYRKGNKTGKDGMWEELADVVVRLFDFIARFGHDDGISGEVFMSLVAAKMAKNESRPHLHGKGF